MVSDEVSTEEINNGLLRTNLRSETSLTKMINIEYRPSKTMKRDLKVTPKVTPITVQPKDWSRNATRNAV